jgi:hypothetical protein
MYWVVVGMMPVASWYRDNGHHTRNRAAVATLMLVGALMLSIPLFPAIAMAAATWIWAMVPMQWPRASAAAAIAAGAGIMRWALDVPLF